MNLSDLLQNIYSDLGQTDSQYGNFIATGGSPTTFINTEWGNLENPPETDALKGRIAFVHTTTDGLEPQGKYAKVSAYVDSTYTATIVSVTDAIESGDNIILAKQDLFPLQEVIFRANRALTNLGEVSFPDVSLTTTTDREYALPLTAKRKLVGVFYDDTDWIPVSNYQIHPTSAGSTGLLILPDLPAGKTLKLVYRGIHPAVSVYSSVISEYIHPSVVTNAAILEVLSWFNRRDENQGSNEYYVWLEEQYRNNHLPKSLLEHPITQFKQAPKYFTDDNVPTNIFGLGYYR